jgi:hypothetical protein
LMAIFSRLIARNLRLTLLRIDLAIAAETQEETGRQRRRRRRRRQPSSFPPPLQEEAGEAFWTSSAARRERGRERRSKRHVVRAFHRHLRNHSTLAFQPPHYPPSSFEPSGQWKAYRGG